ncbi:MAG: hypothetical protein K2L15_02645, partial [Eubacteriales bacterium]|nr:hypothetical protein [Eubacteriales bacterium]
MTALQTILQTGTFRQSSHFLDPIGFFLLIISNLFFSLLVLKHWKSRLTSILLIIIYPILCTLAVIQITKVANEPSAYIALFMVSMVSLLILVKVRLEEAIFLSVFQSFHMIFVKGVAAGAMSLIEEKNMYQLFQVVQYEQLIICIAHALLATLFCIYYLTFNKKKMSAFFISKGQVYYVSLIHMSEPTSP